MWRYHQKKQQNINIPSRERSHIPPNMAFWVDDVPNFPKVGYVSVPWRVNQCPPLTWGLVPNTWPILADPKPLFWPGRKLGGLQGLIFVDFDDFSPNCWNDIYDIIYIYMISYTNMHWIFDSEISCHMFFCSNVFSLNINPPCAPSQAENMRI